jgi:hypothetical protein
VFDYTVTTAAGTEIVDGTVSQTTSGGIPGTPRASTFTRMNSTPLGDIFGNGGTASHMFSPAATTIRVLNDSGTSRQAGAQRFGTVTNTFSVSPVSVLEPMSLSLFGLGLAGVALARRRRS